MFCYVVDLESIGNDPDGTESLKVKPAEDTTLAMFPENQERGLNENDVYDEGSNGKGLGSRGNNGSRVHGEWVFLKKGGG